MSEQISSSVQMADTRLLAGNDAILRLCGHPRKEAPSTEMIDLLYN